MMGRAVPKRRYLRHGQAVYYRPYVFCCELNGVTDNAISINRALANRLAAISPALRSLRVEQCLNNALRDFPDDIVIRDFDVLFNPSYQIDVVALLCSAYRKHHFDLVWPGRLEGNQLLYAEEGYPDYKAFDIDRYDITCIY